jgi:hypothetical protein
MYLNARLPSGFHERLDAVDRVGNALLRPLERGNRQIDEWTSLKRPSYSAELKEVLGYAGYHGRSFEHSEDANPASGG